MFWWLLICGSTGFALAIMAGTWADYSHTSPSNLIEVSIICLLIAAAPFGVLSIARWIITGGWRLGPRW